MSNSGKRSKKQSKQCFRSKLHNCTTSPTSKPAQNKTLWI